MKTILTIDFDILMWQNIELYNTSIIGWQERIERFPLLNHCLVDNKMY